MLSPLLSSLHHLALFYTRRHRYTPLSNMVPPSSPERAPDSIPSMLQDSIVGHSSYSQLVERPFSPSANSQDSPCLTTLTGLGVCLEQRYGADLSTNETRTGIEDGDEDEDLNYQNRWEYVYRDRRRDSPYVGSPSWRDS
ncbi:hypothetical protein NMY22_g12031 [Coprinellus aureogranulatus]|nr:hypothetical protein NMY22_g12031 [Coprinellus aureogranulatus]